MLYCNTEKHLVISVSYDQQGVICALVNSSGDIVRKTSVDRAPEDPSDLVELIACSVNRLTENHPCQLIGMGVSDPGMIDYSTGRIVRSSRFLRWRNVRLADLLSEKVSLPVLVENSARTRAIAEYMIRPELRESGSSMLYLDYGRGVGCALVTPEGVWRGEGFSGELGHVVVDADGRLCGCGARGCLESLTGTLPLEEKAESLLAQGVGSVLHGVKAPKATAICKAALGADRMAKGLVDEITSQLGLAIAFMVAGFHPKYVVVGAESEDQIKCLSGQLESVIQNRILPEIALSVQIVEGRESGPMALVGAALIVFQETILHEGQAAIRAYA
ncbi:MAG: ROK family protein [Planctomycetota bacterium]|nr:ROK family protein [Planctomycetota bacterium]